MHCIRSDRQRSFTGGPVAVAKAIADGTRPALPAVSSPFSDVVRRMWAKEPEARPGSVDEIWEALQRADFKLLEGWIRAVSAN